MDRGALQAIVHEVTRDSATKQSMIPKKKAKKKTPQTHKKAFFPLLKRDKTVIAWVDFTFEEFGESVGSGDSILPGRSPFLSK